PAFRTTILGRSSRSTRGATAGSVASALVARMRPPLALTSSALSLRDNAYTSAPASTSASAIPRPKPRLAPTTIAVWPDSLLIAPLLGCSDPDRETTRAARFHRHQAISCGQPEPSVREGALETFAAEHPSQPSLRMRKWLDGEAEH